MRIAIIGGGFSGAVLAAHLLTRNSPPRVTVIERSGRVGPGLAYGTTNPAHLLNVPARTLSAFPDDPEHFLRWLQVRDPAAEPETFARRSLYGAYIEDTLKQAARRRLISGLSVVRGEAVACRRDGEGWLVTLAAGKTLAADAVVLATGQPAPSLPRAFANGGPPILGAWDAQALGKLRQGDVLLIGAGLTMVDALLALPERKSGTVYALSRRGLLPRAHIAGAAPLTAPRRPSAPMPLSNALRALRSFADGEQDWRGAIDALRPQLPMLWRTLSPEQQMRFLRHARPWWDVHRHRMAPAVAVEVNARLQDGRLRLLAGEVVSATATPRGVQVLHRQRASLVRHRLDVAAVVNCTGADLDLRRSGDALAMQMLGEGLARPPACGLGYDVTETCRLIGADGAAHGALFALGPITQGAFWESTSAPEIAAHAALIADRIR